MVTQSCFEPVVSNMVLLFSIALSSTLWFMPAYLRQYPCFEGFNLKIIWSFKFRNLDFTKNHNYEWGCSWVRIQSTVFMELLWIKFEAEHLQRPLVPSIPFANGLWTNFQLKYKLWNRLSYGVLRKWSRSISCNKVNLSFVFFVRI